MYLSDLQILRWNFLLSLLKEPYTEFIAILLRYWRYRNLSGGHCCVILFGFTSLWFHSYGCALRSDFIFLWKPFSFLHIFSLTFCITPPQWRCELTPYSQRARLNYVKLSEIVLKWILKFAVLFRLKNLSKTITFIFLSLYPFRHLQYLLITWQF